MEFVSSCNVCHSDLLLTIDSDYNLRRCGTCGFVFDSPRPSLDEIVVFYSQAGKYDSWLQHESERNSLWKRRLNILLPYRSQGNLLDIGTGIGQFLNLAQPYFTAVHGTEVSESAVHVAKDKYGLDIAHGTVEQLDFADTSFDNVTLFHVLEHVPDPAALLAKCNRLLTRQGTLIIAVPNDVLSWISLLKRIGKHLGLRPFAKFSPMMGISKAGTSREIHLSHFTPPVLRHLVKAHGFDVIFEWVDPYYVATGIKGFLHSLYYRLHCALLRLSGVNRYETILMIARKETSD